jgi:hypothetical protein
MLLSPKITNNTHQELGTMIMMPHWKYQSIVGSSLNIIYYIQFIVHWLSHCFPHFDLIVLFIFLMKFSFIEIF